MVYKCIMALKTTLEQLEEVQTAITALMTGAQSYTIGDMTVTRANLNALHAREEVLLRRYRQEQDGARGAQRGFEGGWAHGTTRAAILPSVGYYPLGQSPPM